MPFEFRQSINLLPGDRIAASEPRLHVLGPASHLDLVGAHYEASIKDQPRMFLVGGPYASIEEAQRDGVRARRAVLLWALEQRVPIDLGDNRRRGGMTEAGVALFSQQLGVPVRDQLDGLDVYEFKDGQRFVRVEVQASRGIDASAAVRAIAHWYTEDRKISDKQELAAELFCSAGFDTPFRSRFLTLMTALEALLEHQPRSASVIELVELLEKTVSASDVPAAEKKSLLSNLKWLHKESVGQAGRRTADTLLAGRTYDGRTPGSYFSSCYEMRSRLVHSGHIADDVDLLVVSNTLQQFVGDLLHSSIGVVGSKEPL
jgi:hypothetical protein